MIDLSKVIEELWVVLPLRGGLFQQLYGLRVEPAPIVQNAKRLGDFRIVWIGLAGLRDQLVSFRVIGRTLAVEQGELTRGGCIKRIVGDHFFVCLDRLIDGSVPLLNLVQVALVPQDHLAVSASNFPVPSVHQHLLLRARIASRVSR